MTLTSELVILSELFIFIFVFTSFPFYLTFIMTLIKNRNHRELGSPFFKIAMATGMSDLIFVIHHYIFWKAPQLNLFPTLFITGGSILGQYGFGMIFFGRLGQAAGVLLMTLNRLTAVVKPFTHMIVSLIV